MYKGKEYKEFHGKYLNYKEIILIIFNQYYLVRRLFKLLGENKSSCTYFMFA
jgi:hypothetical protein